VGWADAGILVPWNLYLMYGDKEVLRENYDSMVRYMDFLATQEFDGYKYNGGGLTWGDWLSFVTTDTRYIAVAYYALDAQLMAKMSRALSEQAGDRYDQNAQHYEELYQNIKAEFRSRYITPTIRQNTQTAYLMALDYNLLEGDDEIEKFKDRLATMIRRNRYKLNTGFLGTAIINTTLSRFGLNDYAYDLLLQRDCPSWLYSIDQGATTVWERWNSYTKESGFGDPGMNSFNHYAYGAIGQWMYSYMAGISADEAQPGFRHVLLQPQPDRRETLPEGQSLVSQVSAHYNSNYGCIRSGWRLDVNGDMVYDCTVPANTTATLRLPVIGENAEVREGGELASEAEGVTSVGFDNGCRVYELGSGTYQFTTAVASAVHRLHSDQDMNSTGCIYDLTGRAIHPQASGIYVTEGRKIVMK
jgi:alpha-L-rhamnosidase